jgi:hypothetical protein
MKPGAGRDGMLPLAAFQDALLSSRPVQSNFIGSAVDGRAGEDLAWWESSDGSRLPSVKVLVEARSIRDGICTPERSFSGRCVSQFKCRLTLARSNLYL